MKIAKPLITVILLAAAAGGIFYFVRMNSIRADENPGISVTNGRLELKRYTVQSRYPGKIIEMKADRGDIVKKGDVIAVLEDNDTIGSASTPRGPPPRPSSPSARPSSPTRRA